MRFVPGLVSISFRKLAPTQIISAVHTAGLSAIEWGGDVHVPAGDVAAAKDVRAATERACLSIPEYGSYYRIGVDSPDTFSRVAVCACALGTNRIRVWAYRQCLAEIAPVQYEEIVWDAKRICKENPSLQICLECHGHTITDDYHAALRFLHDVDCANLYMFWQPNQHRSHAENLDACTALLPYIQSVHVFSWEGELRFPLARHSNRWLEYLKILRNSPNPEMYLMLEFMHDDDPASLPDAASTLGQWISET